MELASPMEPSQFFVQARQSPRLLNQFANLGSAPHVPSKSALEHPNENDVSSFDQVSLAEDLSGPATVQDQAIHVSTPAQQKERGLASLFDPATLGAVEDLLNMPKSAAFERGMNRLFKGVKSSASSMFASPLAQAPLARATSTTQDAPAHSQAHVEGSSGLNTTTLESHVPPTHVQDQAIKDTLPPPPRRIDHGPPLAANMPQRDSVNMQSSELSSSESYLSTNAEAILPPPPPRAEHVQAKNTVSPKLEGKSHKPPRVPRIQHDWAPMQPMFVNSESETVQRESADQSTINPPEAQQSKDNLDTKTNGGLHQEQSLEHGLSKLFGGIREALIGSDHRETPDNTNLWDQSTEKETSGTFDEHLRQPVEEDRSHLKNANTESNENNTNVQEDAVFPFGEAVQSEFLPQTLPYENHSFLPPPAHSLPTPAQEQPLDHQVAFHAAQTFAAQQEPRASDQFVTRGATPDFLRREHSPILQRSSSPSVLDKNVLLRKQSVVSAILAEQQASSSSTLRANPDTKGKLLEKARGLLEKRQRNSGQQPHQQSGSPGKSLGSPSQSSFNMELRRGSEISQDYTSLAANNHVFYNGRPSMESARSSMESNAVPRNGQHTPSVSSPLLSNTPPHVIQEHRPFSPPTRSLSALQQPDFESTQRIAEENGSMKKQIQLLSAELDLSRRDAQASLLATQDELHKEISLLHSTLKQAEERNAEQRASESRNLLELENANRQLSLDLHEARRFNEKHSEHSQSAQIELLKQQNHLLIQQLTDVQSQLEAYQQRALDNDRIAELEIDNEDLRSELKLAQRQIREQMQKVPASPAPFSITLDGTSYTPEQLTKEAEGLRRQLKGQRADIKEMQDLVKRAENEKRDLQAKIEQLEHSLAGSERLRKEEKSHALMKDEAFKDIQERLAESFELEKAQYIDEEALKLAKLEYKCGLLEDELQQTKDELAAREVERGQLENQAATISMAEHHTTLESLESLNKSLQNKLEKSLAKAVGYETKTLELESELAESRSNEMRSKEIVTAMEHRVEQIQKDLDLASHELEEHRKQLDQTVSEHSQQDYETAMHTLEEALKREVDLKRALEQASESIKDSVMNHGPRAVDEQEGVHLSQFEYDRLTEQASKWQEECFAAQEETMQLGDQLRRMEMQLLAARTEIEQLAISESTDLDDKNDDRVQALTEELEQTRMQLERLRHQNSDYAARLETAALESHSELQGSFDAMRAQLEQETEALSKTQRMLQEKQREVEDLSIELDSAKYSRQTSEKEAQGLKAQLEESRIPVDDGSHDRVLLLEQQLEEATGRQQIMETQHSTRENDLRSQLQNVRRENHDLESRIEMQDKDLSQQIDTIRNGQSRVQELEKMLSDALHEQASSAGKIRALEGHVYALQDETGLQRRAATNAQDRVSLVVDVYSRILESTALDDPEAFLGSLAVDSQNVEPIREVAKRLYELRQSDLDSRMRVEALKEELQSLRSQGTLSSEVSREPSTEQGDKAEVQELKNKLARMEHGLVKLQQFLQEFQDEKKKAVLELQQKLEESNVEVERVRSQLATAQAMLLSRPSDQGSLLHATIQPDIVTSQLLPVADAKESSPIPSAHHSTLLSEHETFKGTERIHHEAILALKPLQQQNAELEKTLLDLKHRYERSQKENDHLLSQLEEENQRLRSKSEHMSPDMSTEHLERIRELDLQLSELQRQLKTAQREREFTRQDMRSLKAELARYRAKS
ncbi:hypothetical protein BGZ92_007181 [Podila epicladia]|nr:hypothetical protein BGZ92_007181 [Podila epicladia]